ncbi:NADPH2:quinone reductase [Rhizoctonia solani]|uniref:NADPH2:quinone reductase n=1 Tax=Rhizoctonia solani TaxID=456999 RepID=A0A0K6G2Q4_9AGAM|nr:NADPH2:quinone reductase [Rhizoctonia solani]
MSSIPTLMKAARVGKQGGLEEIQVTDIPVSTPEPNEILIKVEWAGVNFIDTYFRGGVYPRQVPFTLGQEAAGTIVSLPTASQVLNSDDYKIRGFKHGARYAGSSFAEYVAVPWKDVQLIPDGLSTPQAAASLARGLTALTFVKEAYPIKQGDWVLIHAAAGESRPLVHPTRKPTRRHDFVPRQSPDPAQPT